MWEKTKALLYSEKAMAVVNLLFLLALFLQNSGVIFVAYVMWVVYLVCCIRKTPSKAMKVTYGVVALFALTMIALNLYALIQAG